MPSASSVLKIRHKNLLRIDIARRRWFHFEVNYIKFYGFWNWCAHTHTQHIYDGNVEWTQNEALLFIQTPPLFPILLFLLEIHTHNNTHDKKEPVMCITAFRHSMKFTSIRVEIFLREKSFGWIRWERPCSGHLASKSNITLLLFIIIFEFVWDTPNSYNFTADSMPRFLTETSSFFWSESNYRLLSVQIIDIRWMAHNTNDRWNWMARKEGILWE